jgi:hypothetical protein
MIREIIGYVWCAILIHPVSEFIYLSCPVQPVRSSPPLPLPDAAVHPCRRREAFLLVGTAPVSRPFASMLKPREGMMPEPIDEKAQKRFEELRAEHRRALAEGDIDALEKVQAKLTTITESREAGRRVNSEGG